MKKRMLALMLALRLCLGLLPTAALGAGSNDAFQLPEATGYLLKMEENTTKTFQFTPKESGLYVFSFVNDSNLEDQNMPSSDYLFQLKDNVGTPMECIFIIGVEDNYPNWDEPSIAVYTANYIARLQKGTQYTAQYTNTESRTDEKVVVASPLRMEDAPSLPLVPIVIPGAISNRQNTYSYSDKSGKLDAGVVYQNGFDGDDSLTIIQIVRDGWYSFGTGSKDLSEFDSGYGYFHFYSSDLHPIAERYFAMNYTDAENRAPASIYLVAGEYIIQCGNYGFDPDLAGIKSSFATLTVGQSTRINIPGAENYVTFTPAKDGTYTFSVDIDWVDTWCLNTLKLYSSEGKEIPSNVKWDDSGDLEYFECYSGQLTCTLAAGTTYYLEVSGYGHGNVSVSLKSGDDTDEPTKPVAVTGVSVAKTASVQEGKTKALTATVKPDDADNKGVYWTSDDTYVVSVDTNGTITGVKEGTANVTVTTVDGGFTATCAVTVTKASSGGGGGGAAGGGGGGGATGGGGAAKPSATPSAKPIDVSKPASENFNDVVKDSWYEAGVTYVVKKGLFNGVAQGQFAPQQNMTRAMLVTVLARLDGQDTTGGATWYAKGTDWAKAQGVSDGTMLDQSVTREQMVTMLYRYAKAAAGAGDLSQFADGATVSAWAREAMAWAVEQGILTGKDGALLDPQGTATRAEVATILQRFVEKK